MAIAQVGTPLVTEVASDTTITITYPATTANNLLFLSITNSTATAPATTPADWTFVFSQNNATVPSVSIYYKIATGSETGTFVVSPVAGTAGRLTGIISQWSGVSTTIPIDVTTVSNSTGTSLTFVEPSITTITDGALVLHTISINGSSGTSVFDGPAEVTKIADTTGTGRRTSLFYEFKSPAGATGTRTFTVPGTTTLQWTGITVALRPFVEGGAVATPVLTRCVNDIPTTTTMAMAINTTDAASVRIKAGTNSAITTGVVFGSAVTPDGSGNSQVAISGLTPNTAYYYRIAMVDGNSTEILDNWTVGEFKTDLDGQLNFSFAFGSCTNGSDSAAMGAVAVKKPDIFFHLGDEYYADGSGTSLANMRTKMIAKKTATNHKAVYRTSGSSMVPSDHDGMNNNSNYGTDSTAWTNWNTAFREINPNLDLPATRGVYRSFKRGRIRFIRIDRRSYATASSATDNSSKTCLGVTQKQWFKDQITNATEPVIIVQNSDPWITTATAGDDAWAGYITERDELAAFIAASGKNVAMLAGDMHALAAEDGSGSPGGVAIFQAAPLNNAASQKGGPYDVGPYPASGTATVEQYGWMDVVDTGSQISLQYKGFSADNTQRVTLTKNYAISTTVAHTGTANFSGAGTLTAIKTGSGTSVSLSASGTVSITNRLAKFTHASAMSGAGTLTASTSSTSVQVSNIGLYVVRGGQLRNVTVISAVEAVTPPVIGNWRLAFEELFTGPTLSNKWATSWFNGSSMNNVTTSAANVSIVDDTLKLKLSSTSVGALINTNPTDNTPNGGFSFTTGYAEARIWFSGPDSTHIYNWPAWWTNGQPTWPENGEHDIAEPAGWSGANNMMTTNYHWKNPTTGLHNSIGSGTVPGNWSNSWHKYAVHRKVGSADYYFDDVKIFTVTTYDAEAPHFLILNMGGTPQTTYQMVGDAGAMLVDYVRVWVPNT